MAVLTAPCPLWLGSFPKPCSIHLDQGVRCEIFQALWVIHNHSILSHELLKAARQCTKAHTYGYFPKNLPMSTEIWTSHSFHMSRMLWLFWFFSPNRLKCKHYSWLLSHKKTRRARFNPWKQVANHWPQWSHPAQQALSTYQCLCCLSKIHHPGTQTLVHHFPHLHHLILVTVTKYFLPTWYNLDV